VPFHNCRVQSQVTIRSTYKGRENLEKDVGGKEGSEKMLKAMTIETTMLAVTGTLEEGRKKYSKKSGSRLSQNIGGTNRSRIS
jgi:hypothetical protein